MAAKLTGKLLAIMLLEQTPNIWISELRLFRPKTKYFFERPKKEMFLLQNCIAIVLMCRGYFHIHKRMIMLVLCTARSISGGVACS